MVFSLASSTSTKSTEHERFTSKLTCALHRRWEAALSPDGQSFEQVRCARNAPDSRCECIRLSRSFPKNDVCPMESKSLRPLASEAAPQTRFQSAAEAISEIPISRQWLPSGLRVPRRRGNLEYQSARCECVRALRPNSRYQIRLA